MRSNSFAHIQEGFFEVVCDLGCEWNSAYWYACDSVEVFNADLISYVLDVRVADFAEGIGEAWDYSQVYVVGACFSS